MLILLALSGAPLYQEHHTVCTSTLAGAAAGHDTQTLPSEASKAVPGEGLHPDNGLMFCRQSPVVQPQAPGQPAGIHWAAAGAPQVPQLNGFSVPHAAHLPVSHPSHPYTHQMFHPGKQPLVASRAAA